MLLNAFWEHKLALKIKFMCVCVYIYIYILTTLKEYTEKSRKSPPPHLKTISEKNVSNSLPLIHAGGARVITPLEEPVHTSSVQFSSVSQSCLTLCNRMNRSMPGLPVHHHLPEFTQAHVHRVNDAIQPSHTRSSPSPPAPNPSQHLGLFQ